MTTGLTGWYLQEILHGIVGVSCNSGMDCDQSKCKTSKARTKKSQFL